MQVRHRSRPVGRRHRGFTLIELLVLIAIIAILSSVSIVALDQAQRQALRQAQLLSSVQSVLWEPITLRPAAIYELRETTGGNWGALQASTMLKPFLDDQPIYAMRDLDSPEEEEKGEAAAVQPAIFTPNTKGEGVFLRAVLAANPDSPQELLEFIDGLTVVSVEPLNIGFVGPNKDGKISEVELDALKAYCDRLYVPAFGIEDPFGGFFDDLRELLEGGVPIAQVLAKHAQAGSPFQPRYADDAIETYAPANLAKPLEALMKTAQRHRDDRKLDRYLATILQAGKLIENRKHQLTAEQYEALGVIIALLLP